MTPPPYHPIDALLTMIDSSNYAGCRKLLDDNRALFETAPGASHNHHAWPGGYLDHVTDAMNIGRQLYITLDRLRPLPFTLSDALLIIFLHDVEKPWKKVVLMPTKAERRRFRLEKIAEYGIELSPDGANALEYAEGEHDYSNHERKMGPLAAFVHMCDVASARIWFDSPAATDDPWQGAARVR